MKKQEKTIQKQKTTSKKRLLIIEDEPFILTLYLSALRVLPIEIQTAVNKQTGLEVLHRYEPAAILLDLLIPIGFGEITADYEHPVGFDILEYVKGNKHLQHTKVIILTNIDAENIRAHAQQLGADEFIVKADTDPHKVVEIVRRQIGV